LLEVLRDRLNEHDFGLRSGGQGVVQEPVEGIVRRLADVRADLHN
jgi:hypothetical protein